MSWMDKYKVDLPEGEEGPWRVERFTVAEDDARFFNLRQAFQPGGSRRGIHPGTYTRLYRGMCLVMSDVPAEVLDHTGFINKAKGNILINGLGIGMVLRACLLKQEVTHATVIEISGDLIKLVGPHYQKMFGPRLEIIRADALAYTPPKGTRFDAVWHDIWDGICSDNLVEMKKLHRKYGRRTSYQGSWCRAQCEMNRHGGPY